MYICVYEVDTLVEANILAVMDNYNSMKLIIVVVCWFYWPFLEQLTMCHVITLIMSLLTISGIVQW